MMGAFVRSQDPDPCSYKALFPKSWKLTTSHTTPFEVDVSSLDLKILEVTDYLNDDATILSAGVIKDGSSTPTSKVFYSTRSLNNAVDLDWLKVDEDGLIYSWEFLDMQLLEDHSTGSKSQTLAVSMQEDSAGRTQFCFIVLCDGTIAVKILEITSGTWSNSANTDSKTVNGWDEFYGQSMIYYKREASSNRKLVFSAITRQACGGCVNANSYNRRTVLLYLDIDDPSLDQIKIHWADSLDSHNYGYRQGTGTSSVTKAWYYKVQNAAIMVGK